MKRGKWFLLLGVVVVALSPLFRWQGARAPAPEFSYYLETPSAMRLVEVLSGRSDFERHQLVKLALNAAGIGYREEHISNQIFRGANTVVEMGEGRDTVIFLAHTDRVADAPGANDNASCVAAGIDALKALSKGPALQGVRLRFIFSDGEESGLQGARYHANNNDLSAVVGVASFELCGIGDAFGVWDVVGPAMNSAIVGALHKAGENLKIYNGNHGAVPRFGSDHVAFVNKGVAGVGVTVLPRYDEDKLRSYVDDPNNPMWLLNFIRPVIFQTYHTSGDGPETVQSAALEMTTRLMLETVRVMDRADE